MIIMHAMDAPALPRPISLWWRVLQEVLREIEAANDGTYCADADLSALTVALHRVRLRLSVDIRMKDYPLAALPSILDDLKSWVVVAEFLD